MFAGVRTQSWDVALSDQGPGFLEVNFGGDLNLAQLGPVTAKLCDLATEINASFPCPGGWQAADSGENGTHF